MNPLSIRRIAALLLKAQFVLHLIAVSAWAIESEVGFSLPSESFQGLMVRRAMHMELYSRIRLGRDLSVPVTTEEVRLLSDHHRAQAKTDNLPSDEEYQQLEALSKMKEQEKRLVSFAERLQDQVSYDFETLLVAFLRGNIETGNSSTQSIDPSIKTKTGNLANLLRNSSKPERIGRYRKEYGKLNDAFKKYVTDSPYRASIERLRHLEVSLHHVQVASLVMSGMASPGDVSRLTLTVDGEGNFDDEAEKCVVKLESYIYLNAAERSDKLENSRIEGSDQKSEDEKKESLFVKLPLKRITELLTKIELMAKQSADMKLSWDLVRRITSSLTASELDASIESDGEITLEEVEAFRSVLVRSIDETLRREGVFRK